MKTKYTITSLIIILAFINVLNASTIYVDASKTSGLNNGTDWVNAYVSFQSALNSAISGDEIWLAKGTYKPSSAYDLINTSRYYHFRMKNNVAIYGGFSGTENAISERLYFGMGEINETILNGDLNGDDIVTGYGQTLNIANNTENCYHIFYHPSGLGLNNTAILNGFTIKGGNANGTGSSGDGGAIYNNNNNPTFVQVNFINNRSDQTGGAISNFSSSIVLSNIIFSGNLCYNHGGAIYNTNCTPSLNNILMNGNIATTGYGGGIANANASYSITNVTMVNNFAVRGGGIYNFGSTTVVNNCILYTNTASELGNQIYVYSGVANLNYSCYSNSINDLGGNINNTNNNITTLPLFANVAENDFRITAASPCADVGNNAYNSQLYDIRGPGFGRKLNKLNGTAGTIDMGVYEYEFGTDPIIPCVNPTDAGTIATSQTICSNYTPALISNSISATGFSGTLEYQWYSSTTNSSSGFSAITSATNSTYQSGNLNQTTWFKRLARVSCMSNWNGAIETNVVEIKVNPAYSYTQTYTMCNGQNYNWQGTNYNTIGTYTASYSTINGCDSIYTLNLIVNPTYTFNSNHTICSGQTYNWQGTNYTSAGTYTAAYSSVHGCDSIYVLNLIVNPTFIFNSNYTICDGQTYNWQGANYTTAGTYTTNYSSINGCDSIYTLNLIVSPTYTFSENHTICNGLNYNWQGTNYTTAGTYSANYSTINGCDSIYTLNLIVNPIYSFNENHTMCNGQSYNWQGTGYTTAGTYTASYSSINSCDSIYVLNLNVNTVDVSLTLTGPSIIANLSGETYQWLNCNNNNTPITGVTSQSFTPLANGSYAVLITQGSCSDTSACVQITNVGISSSRIKETLIYPNPLINEIVIDMNGNKENVAFEILNSLGQILLNGNFREKIIIPVDHFVNGIYILKLKNGNNIELKKLIKQ